MLERLLSDQPEHSFGQASEVLQALESVVLPASEPQPELTLRREPDGRGLASKARRVASGLWWARLLCRRWWVPPSAGSCCSALTRQPLPLIVWASAGCQPAVGGAGSTPAIVQPAAGASGGSRLVSSTGGCQPTQRGVAGRWGDTRVWTIWQRNGCPGLSSCRRRSGADWAV